MTDLTAYEQALVERVARAMTPARYEDPFASSYVKAGFEQAARAALSALGLIGPSRTAWIAPWEATEVMRDAGAAKVREAAEYASATADEIAREVQAAMRDAHLKEGGA